MITCCDQLFHYHILYLPTSVAIEEIRRKSLTPTLRIRITRLLQFFKFSNIFIQHVLEKQYFQIQLFISVENTFPRLWLGII